LLDFPSAFVVDYEVSGTCRFSVDFSTQSGVATPLPSFELVLNESTRSGTWSVTLPAGAYYPGVGPEAGCTFHVLMRTP
jgi:hypothetical protein